ncbi:MAG: SLC13 family permease [Candidatus Omnitrophica bacterium]|nr:SLC13 family permease [Candidatus Omnitrophota bacterium]MDD5351770.1 SLC13 family permease [Candidatus Omnitrophota bacterium]MDD5550596.1 SLC13 family permease [Candidatus Omnitrophota bacterium]
MQNNNTQKNVFIKIITLVLLVFVLGLFCEKFGFNSKQSLSISIFALSILGTLFFWEFRLAFTFIGSSILLVFKVIDIEQLVLSSSLEVILFLIGMMVIIGLLKESGFFAWLVVLILRMRNLTARKFTLIISLISALLACAVDEVTAIIFMVAAILEICDYFEVNPVPFIIISVLSTNIGSSGTVMGNPIGILIASKSGLTFEDFIFKAFPIMLLCLLGSVILIFYIYRKSIRDLDVKIKQLGTDETFIKLISVPIDKQLRSALCILGTVLVFISLHHRIESAFGLEGNTILLIVPLIFAGLVMIWKSDKARKYIEQDVEWWTLLFFLLLFAQAGTLKYTGVTDFIASRITNLAGQNKNSIIAMVLWTSAIGSSVLDNVVLVAAFIPIIQSFQNLNLEPLWWALLFGGCLGGNITVIGSTANIVAIGLLEKERNIKITFLHWIGVGLAVGILTIMIVWACLVLLPIYK